MTDESDSRLNELTLAQARLSDKFVELSKDVNGLIPLSTQLVEVKGTLVRMTENIAELVEEKRERVKSEQSKYLEDRNSRRAQTRWFVTLAITFLIGVGSIMAAVLSHA